MTMSSSRTMSGAVEYWLLPRRTVTLSLPGSREFSKTCCGCAMTTSSVVVVGVLALGVLVGVPLDDPEMGGVEDPGAQAELAVGRVPADCSGPLFGTADSAVLVDDDPGDLVLPGLAASAVNFAGRAGLDEDGVPLLLLIDVPEDP